MANKWIYDVFTMLEPRTDAGIKLTRDALNHHADHGWELVSTQAGCDGWIVYYMRKTVPAAAPGRSKARDRGADAEAP